jgi:hypothetical protein
MQHCGFTHWVDPRPIFPHAEYISYLQNRIFDLEREVSNINGEERMRQQQWWWFTGSSMLRSILRLPLPQQECWSSNVSTAATTDNNNGRILWRRVHTIWNVGALLENSSVSFALSVLIFFINCFKSSSTIAFKVQFEPIIVHQLLFMSFSSI